MAGRWLPNVVLIGGMVASVSAAGPAEAPATSRPSASPSSARPAVAATQPVETHTGSTAVHADLDMPIAEFDTGSVTLQQAIDHLRRQTHANLVVFWPELEKEGVRPDARVELHLWDTTLGKALASLFVLGGGTWKANVALRGDMILVGPEADLGDSPRRSIRIYDVRDIIDDAMAYRRSRPPTPPPPTTAPGMSVNELVASEYAQDQMITTGGAAWVIVDVIRREVDSKSWATDWGPNNSDRGVVEEFAGRLVIIQTEANHHKIADLLQTLRQGGSKAGTDISQHP